MILLKQSFDEVLKKYDLPSLYVERIYQSGGQLNLCGPCGKPVMNIPDIKIPHSKLSKDEREYLVSELTKFVIERRDDIDEVIQIRANLVKQDEHPDYKILFQQNYNSNKATTVKSITVTKYLEKQNYFKLILDEDNVITINAQGITDSELFDIIPEMKEIKKIAKKSFKVAMSIVAQEKRLSELMSCKS